MFRIKLLLYFIIILVFNLFSNRHIYSQLTDVLKKSSKNMQDMVVRCDIGNLGAYIKYNTYWRRNNNPGNLNFEYPINSGNYYGYSDNLVLCYKDRKGIPRKIPEGSIDFISDAVGIYGIKTVKYHRGASLDWAVSDFDTKAEWFDKYDARSNPNGSNIKGTLLTHAWYESYRDDFLVFELTLENKGYEAVENIYIGHHNDCDVSTAEGGSGARGYWRDDKTGFYQGISDILSPDDNSVFISYVFDSDNYMTPEDDVGGRQKIKESPAFIGTITISSPPTADGYYPANQPSSHTWWDWSSDPISPQELYDYLSWGHNYLQQPYRPIPPAAHDYLYLTSWGPYNLSPNRELKIVIAVGCGFAPQEYFNDPEHPLDIGIQGLKKNLVWAKKLYQLDWIGPSPPAAPALDIRTGHNTVYISWDNSAETSLDPLSGEVDFEGYKLFKSMDSVNWKLLAQFDIVNDIGRNTGLSHSYTDYSVQNGFDYYYCLTVYDRGDDNLGVESMESLKKENITWVTPCPAAENYLDKNKISVAPNPYYAYAKWNWTPGPDSPSEHRIGFFGLPAWADIFIYTLAGDYVDKIEHRDSDSGVAYWDCISRKMLDVVSGVYLYVVEDKHGSKVLGKFVVIR